MMSNKAFNFERLSTGRWLEICLTVVSISLISQASALSGVSDSMIERLTAESHAIEGVGKLPYRIYTPRPIEDETVYPLIVFMHGAGERGSDNTTQLKHGVGSIIRFIERFNKPAFVIAPQVADGHQWVDTPWSDDAHVLPKSPSASMSLLLGLIDSVNQKLPIDRRRIYITGISMGGFGTWDLLMRRPDEFAAAIPICGGGDETSAHLIRDIPVWVFHGGDDQVVKTHRSRNMINALEAVAGRPRYTEYPGVGHDSWTATYDNPEVLHWLFEQTLPVDP
jgi:predicted peptidase